MSKTSDLAARDFLEHQQQFHLGFLPTEQSNPLTRTLEADFKKSSAAGVRCLQKVDRLVLEMAEKVFASPEYASLCNQMLETVKQGNRIVFSGCGATGRLSILLESMWRDACARYPEAAPYADCTASIMTGGDFALIKSVESFEDYQEFGRQQVRELDFTASDLLVAITEGGETSSVLGTVDEATRRGAKAFLLFNNPASLLMEHLDRSREAISNPGVTVLDLYCGPMALAGSTRMQATTSEQLIAGCAMEQTFCKLTGKQTPNYVKEFRQLLDNLEANAAALANYIDFEAEVYQKGGKITYYADRFLLDIFTDTTERSPTFKLPPFRRQDDLDAPEPWAMVKHPLYSTATLWEKLFKRPLRCLNWDADLLRKMNAPEKVCQAPPHISPEDLLQIYTGNETEPARFSHPEDTAVLFSVAQPSPAVEQAFEEISKNYAKSKKFLINAQGDFVLNLPVPDSPLETMAHLAVKLLLNTASTGIMTKLGRVTGNWMSYVAISNKKLIDRAIRLIAEIGELSYEESCRKIFAAEEELKLRNDSTPAVQYVLQSIRN